nr:hypothetical protein [Flavobacterium sp. ASV13]
MTKPNQYITLGIVFFIISWLFIGLFRDDEFYEPFLFIKYRPSFKVNFYSPIGMQDLSLHELSPDKREEELAFQDFVVNHKIQNNGDAKLWYLPFILIQLTVTFFCLGILKTKHNIVYKKWPYFIHPVIGIVFTFLGIIMLLCIDSWFPLIFGSLVILLFNYALLMLLTRRQRKININLNP